MIEKNLPLAISGLSEIAFRYQLFVIDQWGVMHDGHNLHPGTIEVFERLRAAGKTIAILSNSGKRADVSHARLSEMGLDRSLYDAVLTSGEQVFQGLKHRNDPFYAALGRRCHVFAWDDDRSVLEGLDYQKDVDLEDADFILLSGTDRSSLEAYEDDLRRARERNLPMVCANPDRVSALPDGTLKMCPGLVAERYEQIGGRVRWHGKPQRGSYETLRRMTSCDGPGIGIGDSLEHDVAGALGAGMDALFITGGIHKTDLPQPVNADSVRGLAEKYGAVPHAFSDGFRW